MAALLSVVVPVYGTEQYLAKCLDSLMEQTCRDAEFILVNDCTPDGAETIMQAYAERDSRFRILRHEKNQGLYAARLTGAEAAKGRYIAFLDSDDYVSVDFYRAAIGLAETENVEIVMGDTIWVEQDGTCLTRPVHADLVPDEPLRGEQLREAFFGQEMACYSWHTIWNKVYRRDLFERCMPYLRKLTGHVIMTEDIAFSCVLMHQAASFARHRGDGVFYCVHAASSTGSAFADQKRFFKNYGDIVRVFEFVEDYLRSRQDNANLAHLMNARRWYCRMWSAARRSCAAAGDAKTRADALTQQLCPGFDDAAQHDDGEIWWFDRITMPWNDGLEKIKRAIAGLDGCTPEVVSFDVFDTLLMRPFRQPSDLFAMLEPVWQKHNRRCIRSFGEAWAAADQSARERWRGKLEDVSLDEIFHELCVTSGVSKECADAMRLAECEAEVSFCVPRLSGRQLYGLARAMGRRVALTSDMYLDAETITRMLNKCGISGWDHFFLSCKDNALKWNGGLYRVLLKTLKLKPGQVLHIGDNWNLDHIRPQEMGLHTMHHPRAMDVFTDTNRTQISRLGQQSVEAFGSQWTLQSSLPVRCMQALTANRFFDNGFAPMRHDAFFGASPALMGYYAVGGHILGVAQWLLDSARRDGVRKLVFLARDGALVMRAVELLMGEKRDIELAYHPASRRCLMPALTAAKTDFHSIPINVPAYTPGKTIQLLDFCTVQLPHDEIRRQVKAAGFEWDERYCGGTRFHDFIQWYMEHLYDGHRHQKAYNLLADYYEPVLTEDAACFDMGYSGRLQSALSQLAGRGVPVYFIHGDDKECSRLEEAYGFEARCFYSVKPGMSGAFREFLLSSPEPPCTGFEIRNGVVTPAYGKSEYNAAARSFIRIVQDNALRFVQDYIRTFRDTPAERINPTLFSMPFESTLRYLTWHDQEMLRDVRFEDTVYAGRDNLSLAELVRDQSAAVNQPHAAPAMVYRTDMVGFIPSETPLIKRTIGFLLFDRGLLKQKAKKRLTGHPVMYRLGRTLWRGASRIRKWITREVN